MTDDAPLSLADGLRLSALDYAELWRRYIALGGYGSVSDVRTHIESADCPDDHDHNIIAQALNETFVDRGQDHPVGYRHLHTGDVELP